MKTNSNETTLFDRILLGIERAGNALPNPNTMFIMLSAILVVISWVLSKIGVSVVHPGTGETVHVVNLLSGNGIRLFWENAVTNFSGFAPFGMVMVVVLGSGLAEKTGLLDTFMRRTLSGVKNTTVTIFLVAFSLIILIAGDSGYILMPPLAATIFISMGRHPVVGIITAYATVAGGFAANFVLGMADVLAFGFTQPAAHMIDPTYTGSPLINYYFMFVSSILIIIVTVFITERILEPRFEGVPYKGQTDTPQEEITPEQEKGLKAAGLSLLAFLAVMGLLIVGKPGILADQATGEIMGQDAPFMIGIIVTVTLMLFIPSAVYGFVSGILKDENDMWAMVDEAYKDMSTYILLCMFIAQFTAFFSWSNIGVILAVKGADLLTALNITGAPLLVGIVILSSIINLFIGSASAKWALLAPIFVPMLMLMNFDPAVAQLAYRIGDSITNPLTPLGSYFPLVLGYVRQYDPEAGVGTVLSNTFIYTVGYFIFWTLLMIIWVTLDLPLGPGGGIHYTL